MRDGAPLYCTSAMKASRERITCSSSSRRAICSRLEPDGIAMIFWVGKSSGEALISFHPMIDAATNITMTAKHQSDRRARRDGVCTADVSVDSSGGMRYYTGKFAGGSPLRDSIRVNVGVSATPPGK